MKGNELYQVQGVLTDITDRKKKLKKRLST